LVERSVAVVARGAGVRASSSVRSGRLSRRDFLRLSGAGLAGAALLGGAGCGGGGGQAGGVTNIVFSFGPDDSGTLTEVVNRFNEEYQGEIQAEYRKMPSDTGTYFNQIRTEFQSGASPIDVIGGDVIWPAQLAANGWILDLSDLFTEDMRSDFVDAAIDSVTYKDKFWGVPWFTDAGLLWYRKDLVEESGFSESPQTWDELKEMAEKTSRDTGTQFGFVFQGAQYEGGVVDGLEYIWTSGGEVLTNSGEVVVDQPDPIAGLRTQRSMIDDGVSPIAVVNYKEPETHTAFLNGSAVFCRNWPYMYGLLKDPGQSQVTPDQVEITTLPHNEGGESHSGLGGWNMYVNAASENKLDAIWEFIQFFTMNDEQQRFRATSGGFLPPLKYLYEDQELLDSVPVASIAGDALERALTRPVSPFYSDVSLAMQKQFAESLKGTVPPEEAAQNLQQEITSRVELGQRLLVEDRSA
jgi:multiple sugar transport system substrate-binding protein